MRIKDEIFCVVLQYFNCGGSPVPTTKNIGCPIHYDTIEDGQNKKSNLAFYSLLLEHKLNLSTRLSTLSEDERMIVVPLYLDTLLNLSTVLKYERMVVMALYLDKLLNHSTILAQIVESFNSIKRRTYDCGVML